MRKKNYGHKKNIRRCNKYPQVECLSAWVGMQEKLSSVQLSKASHLAKNESFETKPFRYQLHNATAYTNLLNKNHSQS